MDWGKTNDDASVGSNNRNGFIFIECAVFDFVVKGATEGKTPKSIAIIKNGFPSLPSIDIAGRYGRWYVQTVIAFSTRTPIDVRHLITIPCVHSPNYASSLRGCLHNDDDDVMSTDRLVRMYELSYRVYRVYIVVLPLLY